MSTPFLSSEEYDERAHQLYNEGNYDLAIETLREGLTLYPAAVELHVGVGYARLAREEFAWARRSFEEALVLDGEHEDALAGLGETLLKFGRPAAAVAHFRKTLELGYQDDLDLMLQIGRALFRDGLTDEAREFFDVAVQQVPDSAEAVALVGYTQHRAGDDDGAIASLRRALQLDGDHTEARIYLANILYDRGEYEASLYHLDRTVPDDHWDELGIWRLVELKQSIYRLKEGDTELAPWHERLADLAGEPDPIEEMLADIEQRAAEEEEREARQQLELFGALIDDLTGAKPAPAQPHQVMTRDGRALDGSWEEIVRQLRDENASFSGRSLSEFMQTEARRHHSLTGVRISAADPESFIRGCANARLLRIVK
ncbi:MAG: tetratricopeptide repeat protein [Gemmatimonadetes bacterium]|nr:tetratricopeptide repeat protein [Gemmatimonadota bacterium]